MAAGILYLQQAALAVFLTATALIAIRVAIAVVGFFAFVCATNLRAWWRSPGMRLFRLGGVTTLRRRLGYRCIMCGRSMKAGDKVRTLSCDHVFHCGRTVKCEHGIDRWLLSGGDPMSWHPCPICHQVPHPVLPWKRPPP